MYVLELPLRLHVYAIPTPSQSLCQAFYSTIIQTEESVLASLKSRTALHLAFCCCSFSLPAKNPFPTPNCFRKLAEFGPHDCFIKSCSVFLTEISSWNRCVSAWTTAANPELHSHLQDVYGMDCSSSYSIFPNFRWCFDTQCQLIGLYACRRQVNISSAPK